MFFDKKKTPKTEEDIDSLISEGVDINSQDGMFGQTYLHILVQTSNPLLDYFLTKGPDTNIQNKEGKTPIFYAKDLETLSKLLLNKAYIFIKDFNGNTVNDIKPVLMRTYIENLKKNSVT